MREITLAACTDMLYGSLYDGNNYAHRQCKSAYIGKQAYIQSWHIARIIMHFSWRHQQIDKRNNAINWQIRTGIKYQKAARRAGM